MPRFVVSLSACLFAATASAQGPADAEKVLVAGGTVPVIGVVESVKDGKLHYRQTVAVTKQMTRNVPVAVVSIVDGVKRVETKNVPETYTATAYQAQVATHPLDRVRAFGLDGEPIPADRLAALFTRPAIVLMAHPGVTVDPAYLKVAREGTPFVALLPVPAAAPAPVAPGVPPPPR